MRARVVLALTITLAGAVVAACGDGDAPGSAAPAELPPVADAEYVDLTGEAEVRVEARDNTFRPQYVTVSPGTRVTFDNRGRNPHNALPVEDGAFEEVPTDELQPGDEATIELAEPGEYPYYCSLHGTTTAGMVGRIRVAEE